MNYRGAAAAAAAAATLGGLGCACGAPCVPTPDFVKTYVAHQQAQRRAEQLFALLHLDGSGEVTWRATEEDKGTHRVEIVATDLYGGEARQQFELTVSVRSEESSPAALAEENSL